MIILRKNLILLPILATLFKFKEITKKKTLHHISFIEPEYCFTIEILNLNPLYYKNNVSCRSMLKFHMTFPNLHYL